MYTHDVHIYTREAEKGSIEKDRARSATFDGIYPYPDISKKSGTFKVPILVIFLNSVYFLSYSKHFFEMMYHIIQ